MKNTPNKPHDPQQREIAHENKQAHKGSGPETTKGARKRTAMGLSKDLNRGGSNGTAHNGEVKSHEPRVK